MSDTTTALRRGPEALRIAADELDRCADCGEIHEKLRVLPRRGPSGVHNGWTWASPIDGHIYRRNGSQRSANWLRKRADEMEAK